MNHLHKHWWECVCGKRAYASRKAARAARRLHNGHGETRNGMHAYRCQASGHWHLGHRPTVLSRGIVASDQVSHQAAIEAQREPR